MDGFKTCFHEIKVYAEGPSIFFLIFQKYIAIVLYKSNSPALNEGVTPSIHFLNPSVIRVPEAARSAGRKSPGMRRAAGAARRRRFSTSWPTSCLYRTASAPTWTRPPSWGWPSASCAHASCSPHVRTRLHPIESEKRMEKERVPIDDVFGPFSRVWSALSCSVGRCGWTASPPSSSRVKLEPGSWAADLLFLPAIREQQIETAAPSVLLLWLIWRKCLLLLLQLKPVSYDEIRHNEGRRTDENKRVLVSVNSDFNLFDLVWFDLIMFDFMWFSNIWFYAVWFHSIGFFLSLILFSSIWLVFV